VDVMSAASPITLDAVNAATAAQFVELLRGTFELSPWAIERAAAARPFASIAQLKLALMQVVRDAGRDRQIELIRAHPELAGKAMLAGTLTAESTREQSAAGLTTSTQEQLAQLVSLNAAYGARFGWPFILAVRGPRGTGLTPQSILATFERRLEGHPDVELAECLRNIARIVELRIDDRFGAIPDAGNEVWDWAQALARHSDPGYAERGELTVTYLTDAHRACAAQLHAWMKESGFDDVTTDAVGNVVGVYHGEHAAAPRLLTGSHFDTVRNGGRYDGRLGILVPMACVRRLAAQRRRLPFGIEVVGFAEEEGQRYAASFLASSALVGCFDPAWLEQKDASGVTLREAMEAAGLPGTIDAIRALQRDPVRYLGYVEVHIEQGPVLHDAGLPLGVVTAINGSVRCMGEAIGMASHAGTTPMGSRRDAAAAVAELVLFTERRAARDPGVVGTVGILEVPGGSVNVIPGRCRFSIDVRSERDDVRDAACSDVLAESEVIAHARGVAFRIRETMRVPAAPSDPAWQRRWEAAVAALGLPVFRLPSGAGHDAMMLHRIMPQAMLFVRGEHNGISHNPLESTTSDDMELAVDAFGRLLDDLERERR
jgi:N-carbamoyl-L-amino-acid hydrolase